jgi:hypothetical protein
MQEVDQSVSTVVYDMTLEMSVVGAIAAPGRLSY